MMMIWTRPGLPTVRRRMDYHAVDTGRPAADAFRDEPGGSGTVQVRRAPTKGTRRGFVATLERACPKECRGAQGAFKDSMIH